MKCYVTECREYPHPRSENAIINYAKYWGNIVGFENAEPYKLIWSLDCCL